MQLDPTWQELLLSAIAASAMWVSSLGLSSSALFNFYSRLNFNVEKRVTCVLPNARILLFLFSSFFFLSCFWDTLLYFLVPCPLCAQLQCCWGGRAECPPATCSAAFLLVPFECGRFHVLLISRPTTRWVKSS